MRRLLLLLLLMRLLLATIDEDRYGLQLGWHSMRSFSSCPIVISFHDSEAIFHLRDSLTDRLSMAVNYRGEGGGAFRQKPNLWASTKTGTHFVLC